MVWILELSPSGSPRLSSALFVNPARVITSATRERKDRHRHPPRIARSTILTARARRWRKSWPGASLSPRDVRALTHRVVQTGMLLRGGVGQDHPQERDRGDEQHNECLKDSHASPTPVSTGPTCITRRPRSGPPHDRAGDPFSTRGTPDAL